MKFTQHQNAFEWKFISRSVPGEDNSEMIVISKKDSDQEQWLFENELAEQQDHSRKITRRHRPFNDYNFIAQIKNVNLPEAQNLLNRIEDICEYGQKSTNFKFDEFHSLLAAINEAYLSYEKANREFLITESKARAEPQIRNVQLALRFDSVENLINLLSMLKHEVGEEKSRKIEEILNTLLELNRPAYASSIIKLREGRTPGNGALISHVEECNNYYLSRFEQVINDIQEFELDGYVGVSENMWQLAEDKKEAEAILSKHLENIISSFPEDLRDESLTGFEVSLNYFL